MKICPSCSREFEDNLKFCRNDGTALQAKTLGPSCPKCGKEVEDDKKFCRHCGTRLESSREPPEPRAIDKLELQPQAVYEEQRPSQPVVEPPQAPVESAESYLKDGNFKEAISALEPFLQSNPENVEARLLYLLASVKRFNIYGYEKQIDSVRDLTNLSEKQRELAREIFLLRSEEARKQGREEDAREYRSLAVRVILGQSLREQRTEAKTVEVLPQQKTENKPVPDKRIEKPVQPSPRISPPHPESAAPAAQAFRATPRKPRRHWMALGLTVGVVGVLAVGTLAYYDKIPGLTTEDTIRKLFDRGVQKPPTPPQPPRSDAAQVLPAEELGFKVWGTGAGDANRREAVISERIGSQLDNLRQVYKQQIQQKPSLMGRITVQLTIESSGQVTKVEEFASLIKDEEFKRSVMDDAYKWRFPEAPSGLVKVNYPLLFLPPAMDVATILKWEQSIGPRAPEPPERPEPVSPGEKSRYLPPSPRPGEQFQPRKPIVEPPLPPVAQPAEPPRPSAVAGVYEVIRTTSVFSEPRENSRRVAQVEAGTRVNVVDARGDWLEVRSRQGRPPGFIKKDAAKPWESR